MFYYVLDVWNLTLHIYDVITNGFLTSRIQSLYEAATFKVHKSLEVRMLGSHVVLHFWPWGPERFARWSQYFATRYLSL